jgi:hypothetical protein
MLRVGTMDLRSIWRVFQYILSQHLSTLSSSRRKSQHISFEKFY